MGESATPGCLAKTVKICFNFTYERQFIFVAFFSVSSEAAVFGFKSRGSTIHPIQGGSHETKLKTGNRALSQRAGRQGAGRLAAAGRLVAAGAGDADRRRSEPARQDERHHDHRPTVRYGRRAGYRSGSREKTLSAHGRRCRVFCPLRAQPRERGCHDHG